MVTLLPFDAEPLRLLCVELDSWHDRLRWRDWHGRQWSGQLRRDIEAEAVAASTRMEGVNVTVDEVRRILAGDTPAAVSAADAELVRGYRDAMRFALARADDASFGWTPDLLIAIQDRAAAGRADMGAGRFASHSRSLRDLATGALMFTPPPHEEIAALVSGMCEELNTRDWHPALAAAWAHVTLAAIHPFTDGNGRCARVAASLGMYQGGYRLWAFTTLESWWGHHTRDYYAAFACLGEVFSPDSDVTSFMTAHVQAQLSQVRALDLREKVEHRVYAALAAMAEDAHVEPRVVDAVWDAFWGRDVTAGYYRSLTDVSPATATNDLSAAVAAGFLAPIGERRGRRYVRGPAMVSRVAHALDVSLTEGNEALGELAGVLAARAKGT